MLNSQPTYFSLHADEILKTKGIKKSQLADAIGIKRQNVTKLFATRNITTLNKIAEYLNVTADYLITGKSQIQLNGFVELNGEIFRVKCKSDIIYLLEAIQKLE